MTQPDLGPEWQGSSGLLIDSNLLILLTVGTVNPKRIATFKRTRQYEESDFSLLLRVVGRFAPLYSVAHVAAEVGNLTDLAGPERIRAREVQKRLIAELNEPEMTSIRATEGRFYASLGLTDAAIIAVATQHKCGVLTDDLDLYLALNREKVPVLNFTHLRAQSWRM